MLVERKSADHQLCLSQLASRRTRSAPSDPSATEAFRQFQYPTPPLAVYPDEIIRAYQTYIHTRRQDRPSEEYREPTQAEWDDFEQHFTLRKVAYGNCDRPYGSPCAHEHACVRCPMLRTEPSRLPLLRELEENLDARITEARQRQWLGEVAGLEQTLVALREKKTHAEHLIDDGISDTPEPMS